MCYSVHIHIAVGKSQWKWDHNYVCFHIRASHINWNFSHTQLKLLIHTAAVAAQVVIMSTHSSSSYSYSDEYESSDSGSSSSSSSSVSEGEMNLEDAQKEKILACIWLGVNYWFWLEPTRRTTHFCPRNCKVSLRHTLLAEQKNHLEGWGGDMLRRTGPHPRCQLPVMSFPPILKKDHHRWSFTSAGMKALQSFWTTCHFLSLWWVTVIWMHCSLDPSTPSTPPTPCQLSS